MTPALLWAALLLLPVQEPKPSPKDPSAEDRTVAIEAATAELTRLAPRRAKLGAEEWAAAESKLGDAVTAFVAKPEILEWEHFARVIQATWRTQCPGACAMLCELALQRFEPTAELHTQLGMCQWFLAQEAPDPLQSRSWAAKAARSFAAARPLGEIEPGYVFRVQALLCSADYPAALAELDAVLAHPKFGKVLEENRHELRGMILLMKGDAAKALAEFETLTDEPDRADTVMVVRALALAGRTTEAIDKAKNAFTADPSPENVMLYADVLAFAGEHDQAAKFLSKHPVERGRLSQADYDEQKRSRAALEYFIGLRGKRPADLRQQLAKVLELEVKIGNLDGVVIHQGVQPGEQVDMSASPHAVAAFVCSQPTNAGTWARDALFLACVQDAPTWKDDALGLALLERLLADRWQDITGEHAIADAKAILAGHRLMPFAEGVLTAGKVLGL